MSNQDLVPPLSAEKWMVEVQPSGPFAHWARLIPINRLTKTQITFGEGGPIEGKLRRPREVDSFSIPAITVGREPDKYRYTLVTGPELEKVEEDIRRFHLAQELRSQLEELMEILESELIAESKYKGRSETGIAHLEEIVNGVRLHMERIGGLRMDDSARCSAVKIDI